MLLVQTEQCDSPSESHSCSLILTLLCLTDLQLLCLTPPLPVGSSLVFLPSRKHYSVTILKAEALGSNILEYDLCVPCIG